MTNHELGKKLGELILRERKITNEILALINLALERRSYVELGYASMFDWLVKGFGYSSSAASRRISAAKILKAVPDASQKLEDGSVNLSTLSKAQAVIYQQEKVSGDKVSDEVKEEIVKNIENKSTLEAEQTLVEMFPETASTVHQERRYVINENQIRHQIILSNAAVEDLKRLKDIMSHKFPNASDAEIITYALSFLRGKIDPLRKCETEADHTKTKPTAKESKTKTSKAAGRKLIVNLANARCTYKNPVTGRTCDSTYQVQLDHIHPKALGGSDHPTNFRVLCRQHNLFMAEKFFGKKMMDNYRTQ